MKFSKCIVLLTSVTLLSGCNLFPKGGESQKKGEEVTKDVFLTNLVASLKASEFAKEGLSSKELTAKYTSTMKSEVTVSEKKSSFENVKQVIDLNAQYDVDHEIMAYEYKTSLTYDHRSSSSEEKMQIQADRNGGFDYINVYRGTYRQDPTIERFDYFAGLVRDAISNLNIEEILASYNIDEDVLRATKFYNTGNDFTVEYSYEKSEEFQDMIYLPYNKIVTGATLSCSICLDDGKQSAKASMSTKQEIYFTQSYDVYGNDRCINLGNGDIYSVATTVEAETKIVNKSLNLSPIDLTTYIH